MKIADLDIDIINTAYSWDKKKRDFSLAIVIKTWGSSPRQVGSMMLIRDDGHVVGSVSGGCVEGAVIVSAKNILACSSAEILDFGVADQDAWSVGLSCGGKISVFICPRKKIQVSLFERLHLANLNRDNFQIQCDFFCGEIFERRGSSPNENCLTLILKPKPRLFIVGAVHITQYLVPMARGAGFEIVLVDPRSQFATSERFPDTEIINDWPDEALKKYILNENDCLVTLTHDPKIDDSALLIALDSPLFSISCLGSSRTHSARKSRLQNKGIHERQFLRINGPAGLDINAKNPAEIAVSILAELIKDWRRGT